MNPTDLQSYSPEHSLDTSEFMALNHDVLQSITSLLDLASGFTIAFAECNFWQDGESLISAIADILANDPELEPMQLEVWQFNEPELQLLQELEKRLAALPRQNDKKLVLLLRGLENAIGVVGDYPPFLVDLNFVRDAYAQMVPHPVVFVLPDYAITRVANFAPDFWAWKSGVFKFKTAKETRDFAEAKTIGSNRILGNYLKPEKQERIDLLHRLLMEVNPSGSDPESNRNAASQMNILIQLGSTYHRLSEFNQAINFYDQALSVARKLGDRNGEASSLCNLGSTYDALGQYQQAIQFYQLSLEIFKEIGDHNGEAISLNNLGNAYDALGQYQQAIHFYQLSLEIFKEIGVRNGEANSLGSLGCAYRSLGQYQQAIQFLQQQLEITKEIGDRNGEAISLCNLGNAYGSLGQYQQAIQFQQQSLEIFKEIGDRNGEAISLCNLGVIYYSLEQYQQAIQFQKQSLEIRKEIGDQHGEATSLKNLGLALKALGRRGESIEALNDSRKIYEELGLYHKIKNSSKSFAPLETVAKEPKRFELPEPLKRRKNLFQIIFIWLRRIWSKLWRRN
ncbi:tetratricopeptide repeat protein [Pseudanabaena sp. UWO310]|uniref:tetratricopeptide repeat protein n=1 Tax=Pseudanabaena sp. UWO310 TaxID=2480795 RepID=UPI0011578B19|nr:tetratricopeptide repeat protein [Pseudanabaena sp. UWO310]TYQ30603.1 tetratricopeptide repeat protein [Pseudanabaena sp. UWO310]